MIVACPVTPEYRPRADALARSLMDFGLTLTILEYASLRDWDQNTRARAGVLCERLLRTVGEADVAEVAWLLDADIRVHNDPRPLLCGGPPQWSVAVCPRHDTAARKDATLRYAAGLVGVRGTAGVAFLARWAALCEAYEYDAKKNGWNDAAPEQRCFTTAIAQAQGVVELPPDAHATPEDLPLLWRPPVFVNEVASRTMRRKVNLGGA